jgi:hypothetical protein
MTLEIEVKVRITKRIGCATIVAATGRDATDAILAAREIPGGDAYSETVTVPAECRPWATDDGPGTLVAISRTYHARCLRGVLRRVAAVCGDDIELDDGSSVIAVDGQVALYTITSPQF